jgi:surface polysaccharide O-acyltransferase-like enzyme
VLYIALKVVFYSVNDQVNYEQVYKRATRDKTMLKTMNYFYAATRVFVPLFLLLVIVLFNYSQGFKNNFRFYTRASIFSIMIIVILALIL